MLLTQHTPFRLPVLGSQPGIASRLAAAQATRVVLFAAVRNRARPLDRLAALAARAQRMVQFRIVELAVGLPLEDVKGLVGERLVAGRASKAVAVVLAFELPIGGVDGGGFNVFIATTALRAVCQSMCVYAKCLTMPELSLTLGRYIFFQHLSQRTPLPSSILTHLEFSILNSQRIQSLTVRSFSLLSRGVLELELPLRLDPAPPRDSEVPIRFVCDRDEPASSRRDVVAVE